MTVRRILRILLKTPLVPFMALIVMIETIMYAIRISYHWLNENDEALRWERKFRKYDYELIGWYLK